MKIFNRFLPLRSGFLAVFLSIILLFGSGAVRAQEDHGNPGRFIENIKKGLSGLSQYFWSPQSEAPIERKAEKASSQVQKEATTDRVTTKPDDKNGLGKQISSKMITKEPVTDPSGSHPKVGKTDIAQKAGAAPVVKKVQSTSGVKTVASEVKKPVEIKKPAKELAASRVKKGEPKKQVLVAKSPSSKQKTVVGSAVKKSENVNKTQNIAVAKSAQTKQAVKKPSVSRSFVAASKTPPKASKKTDPAVKTVKKVQKALPKKPVVSLAEKANIAKPKAEKKIRTSRNQAASHPLGSAKKMTKKIEKKAITKRLAVASVETTGQKKTSEAKGQYIWVPGRGTELDWRFGLTGIPADRMIAKNDLKRTDGRWVFAPRERGIAPGLYGFARQIQAAPDGGTWVGAGRYFIYVFDRKRSYASLTGGSENKAGKKTIAKASSGKEQKKKLSALPNTNKGVVEKQRLATVKKRPAADVKEKRRLGARTKLAQSGQRVQSGKQTKSRHEKTAKRKNAVRSARSGNWSKLNGRWVYVPVSKAGGSVKSSVQEMTKAISQAPSVGGWVQRNKRWIYVAPAKRSNRQALNGRSKTPLKKRSAMTEKAGLAEGPGTKTASSLSRDAWVRKNNRWTKVNKPLRSAGTALAGKAQAVRPPVTKREVKKPIPREFIFFVPGRAPGTGAWFRAPTNMMKQARRIQNPAIRR